MHTLKAGTSLLTLSYLAVSTTLPFMWSYKETRGTSLNMKGHINARTLFTKI